MDPHIVDNIVHEVKSQGVFDEFRKDSMADVDTKPAYQNLRQRVENAVKKYLGEQAWTPETNKNQLRERLRRHIAESGFLDVGVERIVDQVVNPKIGSVFQPKIEEIAYKFLGIPQPPVRHEPPPPPLIHPPFPPLPMNGSTLKVDANNLLPVDLEQVSPDSDRATIKSEPREGEDDLPDMDVDEKPDDDWESPPFEPLVKCTSPVKVESVPEQYQEYVATTETQAAHSGLAAIGVKTDTETQDTNLSARTAENESEKEASLSLDAIVSQDSQLSRVSSNSRISVVSHENSQTVNTKQTNEQSVENANVNISEEAQMPKFSDNSSEANIGQNSMQLHFDIKKDEIKFEGTERKPIILSEDNKLEFNEQQSQMVSLAEACDLKTNVDDGNKTFKFTNSNDITEVERMTRDNSLASSLDDTVSSQLYVTNKSQSEIIQPSMPYYEKSDSGKAHSSSSRSRHKKHSKEKNRSNDRDRSKDNDRDRSKDKKRDRSRSRSHNRSKNTSSSSKQSNNTNTPSDKTEKTSIKNAMSSSSSSSSRSEALVGEAKRTRRDAADDRKHSSSSNGKSHQSNASSSQKRGERKSDAANDDHNEMKDKPYRRKSTDSNDEGKHFGPNAKAEDGHKSAHSTLTTNSYTKMKSKSSNGTNSKSSQKDSSAPLAHDNCQLNRSNVVILNDILQNPLTDFIKLETTSSANRVQVFRTTTTTNSNNNNNNTICIPTLSGKDVFFFEDNNEQFTSRLQLLDNAMNSCRTIVNSLRFDSYENYDNNNHHDSELYERYKRQHPSEDMNSIIAHQILMAQDTRAVGYKRTSEMDEFECNDSDDNTLVQRKRHKYNEDLQLPSISKASPTPSDMSVNSKENETIDAISDDANNRRRSGGVNNNKLNLQQRYTSEDLYKPRPILSQKSRRRGLDSLI